MKLSQLLRLVGGHVRVFGDDEEAGHVFHEAQRAFQFADVGGVDGELEQDVVSSRCS